ncbi:MULTISPECIES: site-specific integrase [unclassified Acinetobacter]|uniref:tyrosine-type recombinase/integrase n=1 Tax=unclassified Acinetobacter TaxID=196816 RepID=UPI002935222F|nr:MULTISPECIES: site-specific integrase [unclassified Acinetobacter]WOE33232.1 site-specific integrase [Acinetobacter sp. SAAs470]WOE36987.1 site-specific integrase [Acinetobacter sp. SAAs474]
MAIKNGKAPFITQDDFDLTMKSIKGRNANRNRVVMMFSHFLGLRAKELAALKIRDVIDNKGRIKETIRLLAAYTKGGVYREVFLVDPTAQELLKKYIYAERSINQGDSALFLSQKGGNFSANTMQRMITNIYKNAGIKASSHSGRRTFATRLIRENVDIYSIQQLMGHSSIQTTQEYFVSDPNLLKAAVYKLSK